MEDIISMLEEDVARAQESYHMEEGELVLVKKSRCRERARQEVEGWGWGVGVETLESLECQSSLHRQHPHLCWGEQERGQATEQLGAE